LYYTDITNVELQQFHKVYVPTFTIKLTDVLTSDLFKVETVIADTLYKIFPLFYCKEIISSNPNDNILDTQCIICQKTTNETYFTFITNNDGVINDFNNYVESYYDIQDVLSTADFNTLISLLRNNTIHNDPIKINDLITGIYGTYEFDITDTTQLDNGIVVSDETITAEPKVKLSNPTFFRSKYTLQLKVLHYTDANVTDETTDFKVVDTLEIELTPNVWVDIPVADLEEGYIILYDSNVEIRHNKNIIQDWITQLFLTGDKQIIQTGETVDLVITALDDMGTGIDGKGVYFIQKFEPLSLNLKSTNPIFQTGEKSNIQAKIVESDGQLMDYYRVDFYEIYTPTTLSLACTNPIIQTGEKANLQAKLKDEDGSLVKGVRVDFYEEYTPTSIRLTADKSIIQTSDVADLTATLKDSDGSRIHGETVYFYEKYETTSIDLQTNKSVIVSDEVVSLYATLKDFDGSLISGETIYFFEKIEE